MNDQKSNYYTQLILKALLNKEMVTTGQLAEEIGLSEKTIRTKVEVINNMLLDNQLGEICKKPRIGIWLNADAQQRLKLNSLINNSTNMDVLQNDQVRHRNSAEADLEKHEEQHADDQAAGLPALSQRTDDAQGDQRLPQLAEAV